MQITDVRGIPLSYQVPKPFMSAAGVQRVRHALLVEVETDDGLVGIGEASTAGGPAVSTQVVPEQELKPLLVGEDPMLIERIWQKVFYRTRAHGRRGLVMNALSGVDIALWDIAGKVAKLPLYKLFGAFSARVEGYATGGFYEEGKGIGDLAEEVGGYVERGYRGVKIKVGRYASTQRTLRSMLPESEACVVSFEEDLARVAAVRQAIGPEAKLMVDANCAWSPPIAIQVGQAMDAHRLYWIEEPVETDDVAGSAEVARALAPAIAGYETESGLYGFRQLIEAGAVDFVQPDIARAGGFSECRRIAALAHAHNLPLSAHAFGSAVTTAASLHFLASIPNGIVIEMDETSNALRSELLEEPIGIGQDSLVRVPEGPGLGIELNRAALDRYRLG